MSHQTSASFAPNKCKYHKLLINIRYLLVHSTKQVQVLINPYISIGYKVGPPIPDFFDFREPLTTHNLDSHFSYLTLVMYTIPHSEKYRDPHISCITPVTYPANLISHVPCIVVTSVLMYPKFLITYTYTL